MFAKDSIMKSKSGTARGQLFFLFVLSKDVGKNLFDFSNCFGRRISFFSQGKESVFFHREKN